MQAATRARRAAASQLRARRCARSLSQQPQLVELTRADVLTNEGRYAEALQQLDRAREIVLALPEAHPLKTEVRVRDARVRHMRGEWSGEANAWTQVVKNHEDGYGHVEGLAPLALAMLRLGEYKAAMNVVAGGMAACNKLGDARGVGACAFLSAYGLYLERSDLADEVLESSLEAAREATPRATAVGDMLKLRGLYQERVAGDAAAARTHYTRALRFFEKHHGESPDEAAKALVHLGGLEGRAQEREAAEAHFSRALSLLTTEHGDGHPSLSRALRPLAGMYTAMGEPVMAEGLYRSSVDGLKAAIEHTPGCDTALLNQELAGNLEEFAALMARLEWNGKPRVAEAEELLDEARAIQEKFPAVALGEDAAASLWDESLAERYAATFFF